MKRISQAAALFLIASVFSATSFAADAPKIKPDITVAQDGSGDFKGLQEALDSIPQNNVERKIIFIKNGEYKEHIRVANSFITLLGEDRMKTRLVYEIGDGRNIGNANNDRRGTATFNLANANDIIVDNLTIDNPANTGGKPFVVYSTGQGTRIIMQNIEVLGRGGDSLSLWTRGMYYHRNLHVTGTYHFLGPRGTCYVTDSVIECLGSVNNAIFNEGIEDVRAKLVVKNSQIVSKVPFGLGSNFRDAAWYFIDCQFPETLKPDGKIFIAQSNVNNPQPISAMFKYEPVVRVYFAGSKGPDYPWLKDNIDTSPAKTAAAITPAWTFWNQWDPENTAAPTLASTSREADTVSIKFSESVTVKGKPTIKLADGKTADYVAGSGTDTLTFKAPTSAAADTVNLNGSTILASIATAQMRVVPDGLKLQK